MGSGTVQLFGTQICCVRIPKEQLVKEGEAARVKPGLQPALQLSPESSVRGQQPNAPPGPDGGTIGQEAGSHTSVVLNTPASEQVLSALVLRS